MNAQGPSPRLNPGMAFDTARGKSVMFGGESGSGNLGDTWEYEGGLATATTYGSGCGNPALVLAPVATARPVIGTTARATVSNIPLHVHFVYTGWNDTIWGPFNLPFALGVFGMPGCEVLQSVDIGPFFPFPTAGTSVFELQLPNWSGLVGLEIYLQAAAVAPGMNPANLIASNGLAWIVGDR